MRGYSSKEIIKILLEDGWYEYSSATGSHHSFRHHTKKRESSCTTSKKRFTNWNSKKYNETSSNKIDIRGGQR